MQHSLSGALGQDTKSLSSDPWLLQITLATRTFALPSNQSWPQSYPPTSNFRSPVPWELPVAVLSAIQLLPRKSKKNTTTIDLQQHALIAMARVTEPESAVYFTDSSIDPDRGRMGAAAITGVIELATSSLLHPAD